MAITHENIVCDAQAEAAHKCECCSCQEQEKPCNKKKDVCVIEHFDYCSKKCYTCEVVCRRKVFEPTMKVTKCYPECAPEPCCCCCCRCCCDCCNQQ